MGRRSLVLAVGGAVVGHVAAAAYFAGHDPYTSEILPPCPVLQLTGWQCPGCGGLRALHSLLHGDLAQSFAMNPLLLALYGAAGLLSASAVATSRARSRLGNNLALAALCLVATAGVYTGVVRNLIAGWA